MTFSQKRDHNKMVLNTLFADIFDPFLVAFLCFHCSLSLSNQKAVPFVSFQSFCINNVGIDIIRPLVATVVPIIMTVTPAKNIKRCNISGDKLL